MEFENGDRDRRKSGLENQKMDRKTTGSEDFLPSIYYIDIIHSIHTC